MVTETRIVLTTEELADLAQKLEGFASSLPERERAFLEQMLTDASDAANEDPSGYANLNSVVDDDDEVSGYSMAMPGMGSVFGTVVGYAGGLARDEAETIDDSVSVS